MTPPLIISLVFLLASGIASHAEKPPTFTPPLAVAVYDFNDTDKNLSGLGGKVTTLVTANLTTETNLVMLERADLSKVLNEQAFDISGIVSSDAAATIGQVTGVKVLVAGQIIPTGPNRVVLVANIIGTETSRLFTATAEGSTEKLLDLTGDLSRKIARTIIAQATNLVNPPAESREQRIARIIASIAGPNRPSVSVKISSYNGQGHSWDNFTAIGELSSILLKAGFVVVDEGSDAKPDVEITGFCDGSTGLPRGGLITARVNVDLKVHERRTRRIICYERQESTAIDIGASTAGSVATIKAVDELAARIVLLLAK